MANIFQGKKYFFTVNKKLVQADVIATRERWYGLRAYIKYEVDVGDWYDFKVVKLPREHWVRASRLFDGKD